MHAHGFCSPYSEVKKFKRSAAAQQSTDLPDDTDGFVQHMADNVDHNLRTLDSDDGPILSAYVYEKSYV